MTKLTTEQREIHEQLKKEFPYCCACGIAGTAPWSLDPDYPRNLENHHILGGTGQRKTDRRNLIRLCKLCHDLAHLATIKDNSGKPLQVLQRENVLWLKKFRDTKHFDLHYLNSISIQRMPEPECPPTWFVEEWTRTQDSRVWGRR